MVGHLHGLQLVDVIPSKIVMVLDIRVHIVAIQVFRQVDKVLDTARMFAHLHSGQELIVLAPVHIIQLRCQIIQLVQVGVLTQLVIETAHITVIVGNEPFLIGVPEIVLGTDSDTLKYLLQLVGGGGKLHPFAHKLALVVLAQVGDKGSKRIILVILKMRHRSSPP